MSALHAISVSTSASWGPRMPGTLSCAFLLLSAACLMACSRSSRNKSFGSSPANSYTRADTLGRVTESSYLYGKRSETLNKTTRARVKAAKWASSADTTFINNKVSRLLNWHSLTSISQRFLVHTTRHSEIIWFYPTKGREHQSEIL